VAVEAGLEVHVLEMEGRILQRVTTEKMSAYYHQLHESRGVHIHTGAAVTAFKGSGHVEGVICGDGDEVFPADIVIVGIGIVPNVEVAQAAGIECDNGIVVDDHCRTSVADVFAAGDCTNHPNALLDRRLRLESVPNAMEQARVAAANMCGGDKHYASIPWFWSDQYELKLQMVGFSADGDTEIVRGDMASNQFAVFYLKDGKLVAADAVNSPKEFMVCRQLVGQPVDADALANPDTDLKTLLKR
jgi:3-phenylpropionate/trans-cinnamate dioxygenase ferredoxin reductase subunit